MTDTGAPAAAAPAAPASQPAAPAAAPAAPAGAPTHVTQAHKTDYQQAPAGGEPAKPSDPAKPAAPAADAKPDSAAMKAYLAEKAKDVSLEGKSDADIEQLYADTKAKEPAPAEFKLPDEYKDKPWAAKVKSQDDLYKQIDNLTTLVGKKSVVPNLKEASPEDKEAFYAQMRGKDAAEYQIPNTTSVPIPADTQPEVARLFMENGISPVQAEPFLKGYLALREKQIGEFYNPDGFNKAMETAFGPDHKQVTGAVRNTITAMMSPDDAKALDAIPNNLLGVVYRTLGNTIKAVDDTLKKYGATESFAHLKAPGGQVQQADMNAQRAAWRTELAGLSMRPHEAAEKDAIINKIADSYKNDPRLQPA